jgi:dTMP kinase
MTIAVSSEHLEDALEKLEAIVAGRRIPQKEELLRDATSKLPKPISNSLMYATKNLLARVEIGRRYFIVLAGIDKAGKETQCNNPKKEPGVESLCDYLSKRGFNVHLVNLPTYGSPLGDLVGSYLGRPESKRKYEIKGQLPKDIAWILWSLDRAQHGQTIQTILKKSEERNLVLSKRWTESQLAYQLANGVDAERILRFERNIIQPSHTFLIDISAEEAIRRMSKSGELPDIYEKVEYLRAVRQHYLNLHRYRGFLGEIIVIDGERSPIEVNRDILSRLLALGY